MLKRNLWKFGFGATTAAVLGVLVYLSWTSPALAKKKPKSPCQCAIIPFPDGSYCYDEDCMATPECEYICVTG